ncbi:7800_t:CDS:2, partial [Funneliformis geosporum]
MITGCSIIYTISIPECIKIAQSLKDHFGDSKVGIYHSQMSSEDKKSNSQLFKNGTIKFIVATNAFGMGINIDNVRIIIHTSFPLSLDNYIQEIGRARRNGNLAHSFIFYAKGDTRSLLIILTAGREEESIDKIEYTEIIYRQNYLNKGKKNILEMSLICKNIYECRQQIVYQPYLWSNDPDILECGECDNCKRREADEAVWYDIKVEALRLIKIVQELVLRGRNPNLQFSHITIHDIVDVFCSTKNVNVRDKDLTSLKEYGYNKNNVIKLEIELKSWKEGSSSLMDSCYIIGTINMAIEYIENNN